MSFSAIEIHRRWFSRKVQVGQIGQAVMSMDPHMGKCFVGLSLWMTMQCIVVAAPNLDPAPVYIKGVRLWSSPDHTQVVFEASDQVWHKILLLKNPDRLVIDLLGGRTESLWTHELGGGFVKVIRKGITSDGLSLITLDLKQGVYPSSFNLKPKWHYGHRLVIDLSATEEAPSSNEFRVANAGVNVGEYRNPGWKSAYRLSIDQSPKEETANIFREANIDMDVATYSTGRIINDGVRGGMAGIILVGLLALVCSVISLMRRDFSDINSNSNNTKD